MHRIAIVVAILSIGGAAWGEADTFALGNGHTGAKTLNTANLVINTYAQVTDAVNVGDNTLTIGTPSGTFTGGGSPGGDLVLIWQTTGYTGTVVSGGQTAIDLSTDQTGHWELARLKTVAAGTLTLTNPVINSYEANTTQVVSVPEYTTLTISKAITAAAWDGTKGGILAFLASGAVTQNANIVVDGLGGRGGTVNNPTNGDNYCGCTELDAPNDGGAVAPNLVQKWSQKGESVVPGRFDGANGTANLLSRGLGNIASGGGGGDCDNAGGGGGANYGPGGLGGNSWSGDSAGSTESENNGTGGVNPDTLCVAGADGREVGGLGGATLTYSLLDHMTFGGGGGAGQSNDRTGTSGAAGGGVIWIRALSLTGTATTLISANGASAGNAGEDGAGGGGAGGSIYLRLNGTCTNSPLEANGGNGGSTVVAAPQGPGGGGGGGRILDQITGTNSCTTSVSSGIAGVWFDGATESSADDGGQDNAGPPAPNPTSGNVVVITTVITIASPTAGEVVVSATPTVSGNAEPGSTVTVKDGSTVECTTTASIPTGAWSCPVSPVLPASSVTLTATSTDVLGDISTPATVTFVVDLTPPAITKPGSAEDVVTSTPTISGTAADNSTIVVKTSTGTQLCVATTSATGSWSCTSAALAPGSVTVIATETDPSGNSLPSASVTFTVDTTAPTITAPTAGQSLPTNTPTVSGVGAPGDTVTVEQKSDGGVLCVTAAGTDGGGWSCVSAALPDGSHTVVAVDSDTSSDTNTSASVTFTTGTIGPLITFPAANDALVTATPTITGSAEDNVAIAVDDGTTTICTTQASATGSWSCVSSSLSNGSHTITATSTDATNVQLTSPSVTFTVDSTPPTISDPFSGSEVVTGKPAITGTAPPGSTVTVTNGGTTVCTATADAAGSATPGAWTCTPTTALSNGSQTIQATASDGFGDTTQPSLSDTFTVDATAPTITAPTSGQVLATDTPTITGTAPPGSTVTVTSGTTTLCAVVATGGSWTCPVPSGDLSDGSQTVTAVATDTSGDQGPSASVSFVTDTQPPSLTIVTGPPASTNQTTAVFTISETDPPPSSGFETPLCSLDLGTPMLCPMTGSNSLTYTGLSQGTHVLGVVAVDNAGNESAPPASWAWTVTTTPPSPPVITSPTAGQIFATSTPPLAGSAPAGDTVTVTTSTGTVLCTTVATGGTWSCPSASVPDGTYSISATAEDSGGNFSAPSSSVSFTVDTTKPTVSITTEPPNPSSSTTATFTVTESDPSPSSGLATPICTLGGVTIPCTITNTSGSGSNLVLTITLSGVPNGSNIFTVTAVDNAGNQSTAASYTWVVNGTAPPAPTITSPTSGQEVSTSTPTVTGTAPDGSTVTVTSNGTVLCTTTASADAGTWNCTSTAALTDGTQTISATDTTGPGDTSVATSVTVIIDATPPDTIITSGPPADSNSTSATFTFSSNESPVTYECGLDGAVFTSCSNPALFTGLVDGSHTLQVRAVDSAGNPDPTPASYTWTVDTVAPSAPTFTTPEANASIDTTTPVVSGTAEPGSTVTVTETGFPVCTAKADANGNWNCTASAPLAQGPNTLSATATDAAGNVGPAGTDTFIVDTIPPTVTIVSGPPLASTSSSATFTFSSNESPVTYQCTLDLGAQAPCSDPVTFTGLADGSHTLTVVAVDAAGNVSTTPASETWSINTSSTVLAITAPGNGSDIDTGNPTITGTASGGAVTVTVNGTPVCTGVVVTNGQWSCPDTGTALPDGPYTVTVTGEGTDGGTATVTSTFTVDTTPPTVSFTATPPAKSNSASATFEFAASEAGCTFECSLDSPTFTSCTTPDLLTGLADGSHTFEVEAIDPAGNTSPPISDTWTVSTTLPASPVLDTPGNGAIISTTTPTYAGTGTPGDTVNVTVDGSAVCTDVVAADGSWSCASTAALTEATHAVALTETDSFNNTSAPSDSSFTIDTTPPETTIVSGPAPTTSSTSATFVFSSNESDVTYQCALGDGGAFVPCTNPDTITGLANGTYTIEVEAVNGAGIADPTPATYTWTVNTALAGVFAVDQPANGQMVSQSEPVFSGVGTAGDTVTIDVDGKQVCTATVQADGTWTCTAGAPESDGQHQVSATSATSSGTEDGHVDLSFGIDTTPPTTVIISGPPKTGASSTGTFEFGSDESGVTYQCSLDGAPVTPCPDPDTLSGLAPGQHTLTVAAVDGAGNVDPNPPIYTWTVGTGTSSSSSSSSSASSSSSSTGSSSSSASSGTLSTSSASTGTPGSNSASSASSSASSSTGSVSGTSGSGTSSSTSGSSGSHSSSTSGSGTSSSGSTSSNTGSSGTHGGSSGTVTSSGSGTLGSSGSSSAGTGTGSTGATHGASAGGSNGTGSNSGSSTGSTGAPGTLGGGGCGCGQGGGSFFEVALSLFALGLKRRRSRAALLA